MIEITKNEKYFIGYEYKDVAVNHSLESIYTDGYANFGWTLDDTSTPIRGASSVTMKFKRDRNIRNKAELGRLQRQFESCAVQIESLERSKSSTAMISAFSIGLVGTAFVAGSVFSYLAGMLPLGILLAIPALIGWILPYFCFLNIRRKRTDKVVPLINQKYDTMYVVCEKARALLA